MKYKSVLASLLVALPLSVTIQNLASAQSVQVLQVLSACNLGQAQFVGNGKKGRSQLTSFGQESRAGFYFEGLAGLPVGSLKDTEIDFEVPADVSTYQVTLRVRVEGKPNRVQNFSIGVDDNPNLPNLPTFKRDSAGTQQEVEFNGLNLINGKSKLAENDVIEKVSFIFHSKKKVEGRATKAFVDDVVYSGRRIPLDIGERVQCNF